MALTKRQREVYDFIDEFIVERGYSPTLKEIGDAFGLSSPATVHQHIALLIRKGFLQRTWNGPRSVEPT